MKGQIYLIKATNNASIRINTPPSWAAYKQALKTHIYQEWGQRWDNDKAYRMKKITLHLAVIKLKLY